MDTVAPHTGATHPPTPRSTRAFIDNHRIRGYTMTYPAYPAYKDSGVAWLGDVPEHWESARLSWLFRRKKITDRPDAELLSVYRDHGVVPKSSRDDNFNKPSDDLSAYQLVEVGDLVLNKMKTWQGSIAISQYEGIVSPAYFVARPTKTFGLQYMHYLLRSPIYISQYLRYSAGIRPNQWDLDYDDFKLLPALLPPLPEQAAIAAFLDRETAKIAALIAKQERMIALLGEKRQALIAHAVTKGLRADAPMQDSGVAWLGEIPAHWKLIPLKRLSPRISGRLVYQPAQYFSDDGIPFIMGNNVTNDGIRWTGVKYVPLEINERFAHHALHEGDVITVRVGAPGVTCVVPKEADGLNCGSLMIIRRSGNFNSRWLAYAMNSWVVRNQIALVQYGAAQEQINIEDAREFLLPVPPLEEQAALVQSLACALQQLSQLEERSTHAIALMREHRTSLIAAAVTGKIDVRGEVVGAGTGGEAGAEAGRLAGVAR